MNTLLKPLLLTLVLFSLSSFAPPEGKTYYLDQAIAQNIVSAQFLGNSKSVHYEQPVKAQLINRTRTPVEIRIPAGTIFTANTDNQQNIVVTKNKIIRLLSGAAATVALSGNCIEATDHGGNDQSRYTLKGKASSVLQKLVNYLKANKISASLGQKAIWCVTNDYSLADIYDKDKEAATKLRKFTATLLNKPLPKPEVFNEYRYNYTAKPQISVMGTFNIRFSKDCKLNIAMFDTAGRMVRELFRYDLLKAGPHRLKYEFDNSVYTDEKYVIHAIRNGQIIYSRNVDLS
jgi:hypothetical protein